MIIDADVPAEGIPFFSAKGPTLDVQCVGLLSSNCEIQSAFFRFAQRAFIAAEIAALPLALRWRFFGVLATGCLLALGRPGPLLSGAPVNKSLALCKRDISASI